MWATYDKLKDILEKNPDLLKVYNSLMDNYYNFPKENKISNDVSKDLHNQVYRRQNKTKKFIIPWIEQDRKIHNHKSIEIGCGTGASTVEIARKVKHLTSIDINSNSVSVAKDRCEIFGIKNVDFICVKPEEMLTVVKDICLKSKIKSVFLFAVLEHLLIHERISYLRTVFNHLPSKGLLIITELPNRLSYFDSHTSKLPFFDMLPPELALEYSTFSPRESVNKLNEDKSRSFTEKIDSLFRLGLGASFHEFEIALGNNYQDHIIKNGLEEPICNWFPKCLEDELLENWFSRKVPNVNLGFARSVINLIFEK